jgi:hypothetical protein
MTALGCRNLLSAFNAIPYEISSLPEDMVSYGSDDPLSVATDVNLDYETPHEDWCPITVAPAGANDSRLPRVFVDGSVSSIEIAGSAQDSMGYARSIRAGQLGVGAISLNTPAHSTISCNCLLAATTTGYSVVQIAPLKNELQSHPRAFGFISWDAASDIYFRSAEEREAALRDVAIVRRRLRRRVTDVMLEQEQGLVRQLNVSICADGRYVDHLPVNGAQLVVGVIKSMRRRYLDIPRQQMLYSLQSGQRTPAFEVEARNVQVVSFYARISSTAAGAANGLVRVELGKAHFEDHQQQDWSLLDAITAQLTQLRTKDSSYARAAVTVEPIRVIEQRIQRLFHPAEGIAMSALNVLR